MNNNTGKNSTERRKRKKRYRLKINKRSFLFFCLTALFVFLLFFSGYKLIRMGIEYYQGRKVYNEIRSDSLLTVIPTETPLVGIEVSSPASDVSSAYDPDRPYEFSDDAAAAEAEAAAHAMENASYLGTEPNKEIAGSLPWEKEEKINAETGIIVKWDTLLKQNPDTVAWLYLPDSNISYPVVQAEDNYYYLDHNFRRKDDDSGALYFDYRNFLEDGQENWIIYGHRRNDKSMFGNLGNYSKSSFLTSHPKMYLLFPDRAYRVEIFACRTVHADSRYFNTFFTDTASYEEYIDKAIRQSYWPSAIELDTTQPILTLATCSTYVGDSDPRLLVHGRLVKIE